MAKRTGAQDDGHVFAGQRVRDFLRRQIPQPGNRKHFVLKKNLKFKLEICPDFYLFFGHCSLLAEYIYRGWECVCGVIG
jgi:hypothetical protein